MTGLPDNWSVYLGEGQGAGTTSEVVRRFDPIDGGGERVENENDQKQVSA